MNPPNSTQRTHEVAVGRYGSFRFLPEVIYAEPGDIVQFFFFATNHSVIRGEYAQSPVCADEGCNPCVPYGYYHPHEEGLYSGNVLTQSINGIRAFNISINDTEPILIYCGAPESCHPNGMISMINPWRNMSIAVQKHAAVNARYQLLPGDSWPAEGAATSATRTLQSLPSSASLVSTASVLKETKSTELSAGAISGIVLGVVGFLVAISALIGGCLMLTQMKQKRPPETSSELPTFANTSANHNIESVTPVELSTSLYATACSRNYDPSTIQSPLRVCDLPANEKSLADHAPLGHPAFGQFHNTPVELQ